MSNSRRFWQQYLPFFALAVALTAMLGSLYYSEIAHFVPCALCWYQRILMYPLTAIILVAIIKQDTSLPDYVLPLSIIGIGVSTYHNLIERGIITHSAVCEVGVPCNIKYVNYFGFITIPLMALTAFILITAMMIVYKLISRHADDDDWAGEDE